MNREEYTADSICRALGLAGFIDSSWAADESPTLRVVLTPSFHPELCLTFTRDAAAAKISVVASKEHLWTKKDKLYAPPEHDEVAVSLSMFEEMVERFRSALAGFDLNCRFACADGMSSKSCLVSREGSQVLEAHVSVQPETGKFVARAIEMAWNGCRNPRVRNALANAGGYLDCRYPTEKLPAEQIVTKVAVLGTDKERNEYLDALLQVTKKKSS